MRGRAVYFAATGGAGMLIASCVRACEPVALFGTLGAEAVYRLCVKDMPVIVAIDAAGGNLYEKIAAGRRNIMSNCAIVGINWGDEGKGRMVDLIARDYDIVVRYQGGNNAGHTVLNEYGKFALHLLPSASSSAGRSTCWATAWWSIWSGSGRRWRTCAKRGCTSGRTTCS